MTLLSLTSSANLFADLPLLACEPSTIMIALLATSLAATAAQGATSMQGQRQSAQAQEKSAELAAGFEREQIMAAAREKREAVGVEKEQVAIKGMESMGTVRARGLQGGSADAVLRAAGQQTARANEMLNQNFAIGNRRSAAEARGSLFNRNTTIAGINQPNYASAALGFGADALSTGAAIAGVKRKYVESADEE